MNTQKNVYWIVGKIIILTCLVLVWATSSESSPPLALAQPAASALFIENVGQFSGDEQSRFQASMGQMNLRLTDDALWLTVLEDPNPMAEIEAITAQSTAQNEPRQGVNLKLTFMEANPHPRLEPFNRQNTRVSYFLGNNPAQWQADVPVWGGVRYIDLYPGLDWEVTGENGRLVQRLIVRQDDLDNPENLDALLQQIRLEVAGANHIAVDNQGLLHLDTAVGEVALPLLEVVTADEQAVDTSTIKPIVEDNKIVAPYLTTVKIIISGQPALSIAGATDLQYSTFLGGEGLLESGLGLAVDADGYAYITGQAYPGFPFTPGAFDATVEGDETDGYVVKLTPDGTGLVYATFIGGNNFEYSRGLEVDAAGYVYLTGNTASTDFPTTPGVVDNMMEGSAEAFIAKLNPTGTALVYSTLLGGSDGDFGWDLDVDEAGYVYASGSTFSDDFPVTPGVLDRVNELNEAYAVKLNPDATELIYATFLGGANGDYGYDIAVDEQGYAYVTGWTVSPDFPVTEGAFDTTYEGSDGYVAKLNLDASDLVYATFIGGSMSDYVYALDLDSLGNAYLSGHTASPDFPVTEGVFDDACTECGPSPTYSDAFVAKLNPAGNALIYASYLGGSSYDYGFHLAVSRAGSVYVTGYTYSTDFPTTPNAFDTVCESCDESPARSDAFVSRINSNGSTLTYSTFLGGSDGGDRAEGLAIDQAGHVYVAGTAGSPQFPITEGAFDSVLEGMDAFVAKLATGSDEPEPEPTPTPTPEPSPVPAHDCGPAHLGDITVGDTPRGVAVDPSRNRVYVANFGGNSVSVINSNTNTVLQTITGITSANGLAYDATNNIIWVSNYELDLLTPIQANQEATGFNVLSSIQVGQGPWGVAYNSTNNRVYVANSQDNSVTVVDAATLSVTATLTDTLLQPRHLAVNPNTGKVYVANFGDNWVTVIEGDTVSKKVSLWDSGRPYGIAIDETRDIVYVATVHTNRIVPISWLHGQPDQFLGWASFQRGFNRYRPLPLRAIAVNPNLGSWFDGGHVWATTTTGDGSEANQALLIPKGWAGYFHVPYPSNVGAGPTEGIAVDRTTNRVYVSSGTTPGIITIIGDHTNPCWGVQPAAQPDHSDQINIDIFSMEDLARSDVTDDRQVDIFDLTFIASRYNGDDATADLNEDNVVDIFDLTFVASHYGQRHPELEQE
ncbi:MAG: SBBP repeat-containing protein [Anaerolineae bacterium]|nr:SBBP repeat-containing protein [Anaerolineae bacterium]